MATTTQQVSYFVAVDRSGDVLYRAFSREEAKAYVDTHNRNRLADARCRLERRSFIDRPPTRKPLQSLILWLVYWDGAGKGPQPKLMDAYLDEERANRMADGWPDLDGCSSIVVPVEVEVPALTC